MKHLLPILCAAAFLASTAVAVATPVSSANPLGSPTTGTKTFCPFGTVPTQIPNPDYPGTGVKDFGPPAIPPYITVCVPIIR